MALVLGITGPNCAGKDSLASALVARGFESHSLSDVLREELRRRGEAITRPALIAVGNELRAQEGPGVLAKRVQAMMQTDRAALVSIRNPYEVAQLRELESFVLLGIDAPVEVRFARERARGRESAPATLEVFRALEDRENTADENAQQLDATMALADHMVVNDGTLEELDALVSDLLGILGAASSERSQP